MTSEEASKRACDPTGLLHLSMTDKECGKFLALMNNSKESMEEFLFESWFTVP
jgi:hypothetical protein